MLPKYTRMGKDGGKSIGGQHHGSEWLLVLLFALFCLLVVITQHYGIQMANT